MSERNWGCDRKVMSRKACVVDFWRKRNGTKSIPPGRDYWSGQRQGEVIKHDHLDKDTFEA